MSTLIDLWRSATEGTRWELLDVQHELRLIETKAIRPRIPADHLIFRIFRAFADPDMQIKVVLLGQDPYPEILEIVDDDCNETTVSRACGFSFSSPLGSLPVSLRTVFTEILREYPQPMIEGVGRRAARPAKTSDYSGDLSYLVGQGVFLLNTLLTMRHEGQKGISNSHTSWLCFTTQVLSFIRRTSPKTVFLALGKSAADLLKSSGISDAIECEHPAARVEGRKPFKGSNIFIEADALLEKRKIEKIDWVPFKVGDAVDLEYYIPCAPQPKPKFKLIPIAEVEEPIVSEHSEEDESE